MLQWGVVFIHSSRTLWVVRIFL